MIRWHKTILLAFALAVPSAAVAGHSELTVPPADTFLLGGEQSGPMTVSGRNLGTTNVLVLARLGTKDTVIAEIAPGGTFKHDYVVGEIALLRNQSAAQAARLSVDFTGSTASLSMRFALPQKN